MSFAGQSMPGFVNDIKFTLLPGTEQIEIAITRGHGAIIYWHPKMLTSGYLLQIWQEGASNVHVTLYIGSIRDVLAQVAPYFQWAPRYENDRYNLHKFVDELVNHDTIEPSDALKIRSELSR